MVAGVTARDIFAGAALVVLTIGSGRGAEELGVELVKSAPAPVAKGQRATVSLTLLPRAGNRLLDDGPLVERAVGSMMASLRPAA
jgi:hypothetical protein